MADRRDHRRRSGYGFDIGATRIWKDHDLQPRLTLAFAQGSGDANTSDDTDRTYRQTGLQSNEGRLGGFAKLKYYGEALDPDLENLRVATAALGITTSDILSVDLVYHHYRQVAVEADDSSHLGDGIDLVLGFFRPTESLEIDAAKAIRQASRKGGIDAIAPAVITDPMTHHIGRSVPYVPSYGVVPLQRSNMPFCR